MSLERELQALAADFDWPPTPDVASELRGRIAAAPAGRRHVLPRRRLLAVGLAVLLVAGAAVLAVPQARTSILRALGLGSVRVAFVDDLPAVAPRSDLSLLGVPVTHAEARTRFPYPLLDLGELGTPDEIRVGESPARISYVWRDGDDVRLLVSQLDGHVPGAGFLKVSGPGGVEMLTIDGHEALWITGDAHGFGLEGPAGSTFEEIRLSGNALLVTDGSTTIRIEADIGRAQALAIARELL